MLPFRQNLYEKYISLSDKAASSLSEKSLKNYFNWCEYKYLPLMRDVDKQALILDLGCGPGHMMEFLIRNKYTNVKGVDISEKQIKTALKKGLNVVLANVSRYLKESQNTFDVILAIDIIEHFTKDEIFELFENMYAALKKKSILIIQTPNGQGIFSDQIIYDDFTHLTVFNPTSLGQMLGYVNFKDINFYETGPVPKGLKEIGRFFSWQIVKSIVNIARLIETGKPIPVFGDGTMSRDFTYIDDIITGVLAAIDHCKGFNIYNLGESQPIVLRDLVAAIEKALGKKAVIDQQPLQPGDVQRTFADISLARKELGYDPSTDLATGLEHFVTWFRGNNS